MTNLRVSSFAVATAIQQDRSPRNGLEKLRRPDVERNPTLKAHRLRRTTSPGNAVASRAQSPANIPATPSTGTISSAIATDGRGDMRCREEGER